jgi:histidyl-tRNA synthetase
VNAGGGSFKSQFKKADRSGALYALILGENELESHTVAIKPLRTDAEQQSVAWDALNEHLHSSLNHDAAFTK